MDHDAWDIDIYYDTVMWLAEPASAAAVVESGPLRATVEFTRRILGSEYRQRVSLCHDSRRIDISTVIDWSERNVLLKTAFPVDVLSPTATHEIQWGSIERPTHANTSWDWARFETCAQKWVDLSEGGYGVSLLNDCKYGHDIRGNVIRISLLRSPTNPDPEADQGVHRFTYSLLPHAGRWNEETVAAAYALNDPLIVHRSPPSGAVNGAAAVDTGPSGALNRGPLISCDSPAVVIETIKRAEDGDGVIVRLFESQRKRHRATLRTAFEIGAAWRTSLLEDNQVELGTAGPRAVSLDLRPFEIVTLRLVPRGSLRS